jgi:hypothetical protein
MIFPWSSSERGDRSRLQIADAMDSLGGAIHVTLAWEILQL